MIKYAPSHYVINTIITALCGIISCSAVAAQDCTVSDNYTTACLDAHGNPNKLVCVGSPCNIHISHSGNAVKLTRDNGDPADTVCVKGNTVINWYEGDSNFSFTVTFTSQHSGLLFGDGRKQFAGRNDNVSGSVSDSDKVGDTGGSRKPKECSKYTVAQCPYGDTSPCLPPYDPKVIVNGGGGGDGGPQ